MPRRRDTDLTAEEKELWDAITREAAPLKSRKINPPASPVAASSKKQVMQPPPQQVRGGKAKELAKKQASGQWSDIDHRTAKKFEKGERQIDATLDLHGLTQPRAYERLKRFIERAYSEQARMVLVITGKGRGGGEAVLKQALSGWLHGDELKPYILAMHQAQRQHGGEGACYVLLRRRRGQK